MRFTAPAPARRFLLLQGPVGPFFADLARALHARGHRALQVRFNGGDALYSPAGIDFRGAGDDWPAFVDSLLREERITDLVLFGDCRPLHRVAIERAHSAAVAVHVFEEGYLRPGWITLERDGVNAHSTLPGEAAFYREAARTLADARSEAPPPMPFFRRAIEDVLYTLASLAGRRRYPHFRTHKPWHPLAEYRAGARRFFATAGHRAAARREAAALVDDGAPLFLFPLQLDADAQIRMHSPFGCMTPAIETVIRSFARHAPPTARLVVSEHPLDHGVVDLRAPTLAAARAAGIDARVRYLRGGTPPRLVAACTGLVTVNSTVGLAGLAHRRPVATLAPAVYALPGLVHDGALDSFWTQPSPPDAGLLDAFLRVLVARTQLRGGFYGPRARRRAVEGAASRLLLGDAEATAIRSSLAASPMPLQQPAASAPSELVPVE